MIEDALWVAKSLFDRGKTTGASANLSFIENDKIYITSTNSCFGKLECDSFSCLKIDGQHLFGPKPSKEWPLHVAFYKKRDDIKAIIHTHSFYSVLWSCLEHNNTRDVVPDHTPYLKMRVGDIALIPYAPPGSKSLAHLLDSNIKEWQSCYLLANHGPIVGASSIMTAFYNLEELEESIKIAWHLRQMKEATK